MKGCDFNNVDDDFDVVNPTTTYLVEMGICGIGNVYPIIEQQGDIFTIGEFLYLSRSTTLASSTVLRNPDFMCPVCMEWLPDEDRCEFMGGPICSVCIKCECCDRIMWDWACDCEV